MVSEILYEVWNIFDASFFLFLRFEVDLRENGEAGEGRLRKGIKLGVVAGEIVGDLAQMVERLLSMQEALGSMPRFSIFFIYFL